MLSLRIEMLLTRTFLLAAMQPAEKINQSFVLKLVALSVLLYFGVMLKLPKETAPSVETINLNKTDSLPVAQDSQQVKNATHSFVNQRTAGSI